MANTTYADWDWILAVEYRRRLVNGRTRLSNLMTAQMKITIEAIRAFDHGIEQLYSTHEDYPLFASLPGAGTIYAARITAAMGTVRDRETPVDELLCVSGVAHVLERSGKSTWIRWYSCSPQCLRQSFHKYAGEAIHHSFWAKPYYLLQRARGKSHQTAVRALAFQWIRTIDECGQTRTPYREVRYLKSLREYRAPLLAFAANHPL